MDKEQLKNKILGENKENVLIVFPTGYGKSKFAIDLCKKNDARKILVVVPKVALFDNWKKEFEKWEYSPEVTFSAYAGIHNAIGNYDAVIWDECHHITDRVADIYENSITAGRNILLSATVKRDKQYMLKSLFPNLAVYRNTLRNAIEEEALPSPKIILVRMTIPHQQDTIVIRKSYGNIKRGTYGELNKLKSLHKKSRIEIECTALQKNAYYDKEVDFWKRKFMFTQNAYMQNNWLRIAGERLKWLSSLKEPIVRQILSRLKKYRVLTFCSSIEQTKVLGENDISSKNKKSMQILEDFNNEKINHITSVNILSEGVNLSSCQIGVFAGLNSSELLQVQKLGK